MATKRVACPECSATVPYGRLSCPTCGTLLASVAGSTRRVTVRLPGRRSRGSTATAAVAPGPSETPEAGQDEAPGPGGVWPPRNDDGPLRHGAGSEPAWPEGTAHQTTERFRQAHLAASPALHPTNGTAPATAVPDVLHDWAGPAPSVAAREPMPPVAGREPAPSVAAPDIVSTRPGRAVRDVMASAAGKLAILGLSSAGAPATDGRHIPGAYLAPSATRVVAVHAGSRVTHVQRVASAPAVPGPNRWYSVPDATADSMAMATAGAGSALVGTPFSAMALAGGARPGAAPPGPRVLMPGDAGPRSDLPFAAPNGPSGWMTAVGSGLSALAVVLPWAKNGVAGGQLSTGYLGQWGLANPAYLLLLAAGLAVLLITILPNRLPRALREVALPFVYGGFLIGLAWSYATGPFGTGLGVGTMLVGAGLLVTGGGLGLRGMLRSPAAGDTSA